MENFFDKKFVLPSLSKPQTEQSHYFNAKSFSKFNSFTDALLK